MKRRRSRLVWLGLVTVLGVCTVLVGGCSLGVASHANHPVPLPPAQQILRLGLATHGPQLRTLDPARAFNFDDGSGFLTALIFPPLLTVDDQLNLEPWAAVSLPTFDATTTTYTFHIKPDLTWSDGTPIDASTYAYSLNRSLDPCTASPFTPFLFPIQDAQAYSQQPCSPDGQTVQGPIKTLVGDSLLVPTRQTLLIKLAAPAPYVLAALTTPVAFAQPAQLIERYGNRTWWEHLTDHGGFGGNLFRVTSWDPTSQLDLVACGSSCGGGHLVSGGQRTPPPAPLPVPHLRELEVRFYPTAEQEQRAYQAGALDAAVFPSASPLYAGVVPSAAAHASGTASLLHPVPTLQITALQLNWTKPPFSDLRARQAFALALDKDRLAQQLGLLPTNHLVPAGMAGYDPRLLGPDGTTTTRGDVAVARQLLQTYAEARCGGQFGRCPPVFLPTGGLCGPGDATYVAAMQAAVQMWQQAFPGYPVTGGDFTCAGPEVGLPGPWVPQVFASGWSADYADAQDALSEQFGPASGNLGSVDVPAANTLLAAADHELDPSQRTALYHQAEQLLVTTVAWIPLGQGVATYAVRAAVTDFALAGLGYPSLDQLASSELVQR